MFIDDTLQRVRDFHYSFKHPVADTVTVPDEKTRLLRFNLLMEEVLEFGRAIGIEGLANVDAEEFVRRLADVRAAFSVLPEHRCDLVEAADALADIDYVTAGANLVFGFPARRIAAEVHRSNMSKLGADGSPLHGPDGKVLKGPRYSPPDVRAVLLAHGADPVLL